MTSSKIMNEISEEIEMNDAPALRERDVSDPYSADYIAPEDDSDVFPEANTEAAEDLSMLENIWLEAVQVEAFRFEEAVRLEDEFLEKKDARKRPMKPNFLPLNRQNQAPDLRYQ